MFLPHQGSIEIYGKYIFSSVHFLHLPNFVTTTGHNLKKIGVSNSSVSVPSPTVFCIYTRLQIYVCVQVELEFISAWAFKLTQII